MLQNLDFTKLEKLTTIMSFAQIALASENLLGDNSVPLEGFVHI